LFSILPNEHGETAIIGDDIEGNDLTLNIQWVSTSEFGNVNHIYVHRGIIGENEEEISEYHLTPNNLSGTQVYSDLATKIPEAKTACIRLNATTDEGYRVYTNPIWINVISGEINITSPTQSAPAFAGSYNDTNHITVNVKVKTTDGTPVPGCSKDDFNVEIGGKSAGFTLAEGMPGQYILDVSPPAQPSEGLYNLTVTLFGTLSDNESNAVRYGGFGRNIDAVLIIDRSGSMDYSHDYPPYSNRMEAAKAAANDFLDLMILGDRASLVSFASSARLDVGFSEGFDYAMEDVSYQWESDYGTGLSQGDDDSDLVGIGFNFNFYGTDYTTINVKSNGWMSFTTTSTTYSNPSFPTTSYSNVIAPLWDDLNPTANGDVYYNTLGTAPNRRFVVTWYEVPHYNNVGSNTFQAILYESSREIQFNYNSLTVTSIDSQTVGLNKGDGTRFNSYAITPPANGTSIRFYPYEASSTRDQVRNAIDLLYGSGTTAIGEGLYTGIEELDDHGDTGHGWGMILLTDGAWNTGRDPRQAASYASSKGIPIYTIGIGDKISSEFDENLLIDIAGTTNGEYQYAKEALNLQTIYSALSGTIRGEMQIMSETGSVNQSETVVHDLLVDNSISELTITVNWAGSDVDTFLYYPNGTLANSTINPNIEYSGNTTKPEWYRIENPQVGAWSVGIYGKNVPSVGEGYSLTATAQTVLTLHANTDKTQVDVGEPVKIVASIMSGSDPITGANVIANITKPDGMADTLILQDKNNGIYEAYYYSTAEEGGYSVRVSALRTGEFARETVTQFRVQEIISSIGVSPSNWTSSLLPGNQANRIFNLSVNSSVQSSITNEFQSLLQETIGKEKTWAVLSRSNDSHDVVAIIQGTILTDRFGNTISTDAWSFSQNLLTISPGSSETFEAYLNIPADAEEGIYDGSIVIATNAGNAKVDVSVNILRLAIFDTETPENPYPSIAGTHNGTTTPSYNLNVSKLYTYPCVGTGGHTEYAAISYLNGSLLAEAYWNGYTGDWHNITFNNSFTLYANETYNYTIRTASYTQIHHNRTLFTENGWINCTEFTDANGVIHYDWIPAIRLE